MEKFIYELNRPENRKKKEKYVRNIFDSISPVYDKMDSFLSFGLDKLWLRTAVKRLKISSGERVLDGCCGTGEFAIASADKVGPKGKVVATDFSGGMLLQGVEKIKANPGLNGNISHAMADTMCIPFQDESFDAVTVSYGIRNLSNIDQGLKEIWRVLKKGGRFGCLDLAAPKIPVYSTLYQVYFFKIVPYIGKFVASKMEPYSYLPHSLRTFPNRERLKAMMEKAGFRNVRYNDMAGGAIALHIGEK